MCKCEHLVLLRLERLFNIFLRNRSANWRLDLVYFGAVCLKTAENSTLMSGGDVHEINTCTNPRSYLQNNRCEAREHSHRAQQDWLQLGPSRGYRNPRLRILEHPLCIEPL